jgi:hypothetical protein
MVQGRLVVPNLHTLRTFINCLVVESCLLLKCLDPYVLHAAERGIKAESLMNCRDLLGYGRGLFLLISQICVNVILTVYSLNPYFVVTNICSW